MPDDWDKRQREQLAAELKLRRVWLFIGFADAEAVFISYGESHVGPDSVRAYRGTRGGILRRTRAKLRSAIDHGGNISFTYVTLDGEEIICDQRKVTWGDTVFCVVNWQDFLVEGDQDTVTITPRR